jgi:hypothetical protein
MKRRQLIKNAMVLGFGVAPFSRSFALPGDSSPSEEIVDLLPAGPRRPITIYNNWSSYDELSDNVPLTEALAMKQLDELVRLKKNGVHVDYYLMDAFWFDKEPNDTRWLPCNSSEMGQYGM